MQGKVAAAMLLAVMLMSETGDPLSPLGEGGGEGRILFAPQGSSWSVAFDRAGNLRHLTNAATQDEALKGDDHPLPPFRVWSDFARDYELGDDPGQIGREITGWQARRAKSSGGLALEYRAEGLLVRLRLRPVGEEACDWSLQVTNTGAAPRAVMVSFPYLPGLRLGPAGRPNLATVNSQAGFTAPAWTHHGGVVGNGGQVSMQWHALWEPASGSALGLIVMDPAVQPKLLLLDEPDLEVRYFPARTLQPGKTWALPPVRLLVYRGDWRPAARAYRAWFTHAFRLAQPPRWFRESDGCEGRHFAKAAPGAQPAYGGQTMLDSFRNLDAATLRLPFDNLEYAFYSRGSMLHGVHTDGDNVVREDLGGATALREGIARVHRLGLHATLYIEGYIVHRESDLAKSGRAERWSVMHHDGSITGGYTGQGFYHMCPGCVEWQDHLVATVQRLLRETGADGIRLDSLGFYFLPCYNPAHHHPSPFGYNKWMKQLLSKVARAAREVNPQVLLTTEAPVDWYGQWFHGALTQVYPKDLPTMRLAVAPYRPYVYAPGGPVWGAVSGLPGGRTCWEPDLERLEGNWLCARRPVHEALVWGEVADDPRSSDPGIVSRCFAGKGYWAVTAVRPAASADPWPAYTNLASEHAPYTLAFYGLAGLVAEAVACDVETLQWRPLPLCRQGRDLLLDLESNFALVILRQSEGPAVVTFPDLPPLHPGGSARIALSLLSGGAPGQVRVEAPGLLVKPATCRVPGSVTLTAPPDALPGRYGVRVTGPGVLGIKRWALVFSPINN